MFLDTTNPASIAAHLLLCRQYLAAPVDQPPTIHSRFFVTMPYSRRTRDLVREEMAYLEEVLSSWARFQFYSDEEWDQLEWYALNYDASR